VRERDGEAGQDGGGMKKVRIDQLLVDRGLVASRARAQALVMAGKVVVDDARIDKPGQKVGEDAAIRLKEADQPFVSRGGLKLAHALSHFAIDPKGLRCLDLGASTGGFTDCLLQHGAREVVAVDVGYGQLHPRLRDDPRVVVLERQNARYLDLTILGGEAADLVVIDCSFISLERLLPAAAACARPGALLVALVKPQFEVGREAVGKGGVVRDVAAREAAVEKATRAAEAASFEVRGTTESPIRGPAGNVEYLLCAVRR
jgi:23S rRNA (cytidine1920-2'-O)/16S rRNA (cytidine1409-2'-O)-methyltransferase